MFEKLFMESGLSLDRLRALVEVGAAGSITRAAKDDPVRQSQYSRQIKELEDFFHTELTERQGHGIRLTESGRELARISRFFLLGLSNFQRGCLAEGQTFRIGAGATFMQKFLMPALADSMASAVGINYSLETVTDKEVERRLHELTLDFGIITNPTLSRPLQLRPVIEWRLVLWAPEKLCGDKKQAMRAFQEQKLQLVLAANEPAIQALPALQHYKPQVICDDFITAKSALDKGDWAVLLPDFFEIPDDGRRFIRLNPPTLNVPFNYYFAWNPRLLRLNPHAVYRRDILVDLLS